MISILMAAKTSTEYMHHAIGSIIAQSYTDWELIIGVNGLPEMSDVWRNAYQYTNPIRTKCRVYDFPELDNKAKALNQMMKVVRGEWVAILDVDDLWHPLKLERQMGYAKSDVICDCDAIGTLGLYFGPQRFCLYT